MIKIILLGLLVSTSGYVFASNCNDSVKGFNITHEEVQEERDNLDEAKSKVNSITQGTREYCLEVFNYNYQKENLLYAIEDLEENAFKVKNSCKTTDTQLDKITKHYSTKSTELQKFNFDTSKCLPSICTEALENKKTLTAKSNKHLGILMNVDKIMKGSSPKKKKCLALQGFYSSASEAVNAMDELESVIYRLQSDCYKYSDLNEDELFDLDTKYRSLRMSIHTIRYNIYCERRDRR